MKYILSILLLIIFASCKKEETVKEPTTPEVVQQPEVKVEKPEIKVEKPAVVKPTMDIFAAIDAENIEEIRRNIEFDKGVLKRVKPKTVLFPLHYAGKLGKLDSVKIIAEYCDVNLRSPHENGGTTLILAAMHGHFEVVKFLVEKGADVNIIFGELKNGKVVNSGFTALYASWIDNNYKITQYLIDHGADPKIICDEQFNPETALDIATLNNSNLSKLVLQKFRAKTAAELLKK